MINIIYPLIKSNWEKEILYSLRSIERYFLEDFKVSICGDWLPEWITNIDYFFFNNSVNRTDKNIAQVLSWACNNFEEFILWHDDHYLLREITYNDLKNKRHLNRMSSKMPRGNRDWHKLLWASYDLLKTNNVDVVYNYVTHTPYVYNTEKMFKCAESYPIFEGNVLPQMIYYNLFPTSCELLIEDRKVGFYSGREENSFNEATFLNHNDCGLTEDLKQKIEKTFNIKSKFEL